MKSAREIVDLLALYKAKAVQKIGIELTTVSSAYSFVIMTADNFHLQVEMGKDQDWPVFESVDGIPAFFEEINKQLAIADSVAKLAVNCVRGDDYRPGNFSKVILATRHIELQQVNHMNAKSLDHKNDYSLRSLTFLIPLDAPQNMSVEFDERSSKNNRDCGDRIKAKLEELNLRGSW